MVNNGEFVIGADDRKMLSTGQLGVCVTAFFLPFVSLKPGGRTKPADQLFYQIPAKGSESYALDALEDDFTHERSPKQPNRKFHINEIKRSRRKKQLATNANNNGSKNNNDKTNSNRKRQRGYKWLTATSFMPPWLSQFEDDDLQRFEEIESPSLTREGNFDGGNQNSVTHHTLQRLQLAMSGIFYNPDSIFPNAISYFTSSEIKEVLDAIRVAAHSNLKLMAGCADFLYMMLTLEEEGMLKNDFFSKERWDDDDINDIVNEWSGKERKQPYSIMTRDVLIAAAFHYCDCVRARKAGVYDYVRQAMEASLERPVWKELEMRQELWLPPVENTDLVRRGTTSLDVKIDVDKSSPAESSSMATLANREKLPIERYGKESVNIASGAARLKRAEIMAASVSSRNASLSRTDAETLRSFLVSLSEDWRGLVIRSAACLYRLKGIVHTPELSSGQTILSTTTMRAARDALHVYAPLAQRLGMQRLKSELENTAFRILYRRQYSVATALYSKEIDEMNAIVQVLTTRIEQVLRSDLIFLGQIDNVTVSSRVKEPYSLWRKMLRFRKQAANARRDDMSTAIESNNLSIRRISDAIALRVILRASKMSQWEDEDSLRTREKMLCYYALQLISDVWPPSTANNVKDYIQNPKGNGYQSLHYTASLTINGDEWPFEVQIRSEEMHRIAEFGLAAHWDYKLQPKVSALPESSAGSLPMLALPATGNFPDTTVEKVTNRESDFEPRPSKSQQKGRIESYIEALTNSRENLVQTKIFVFISSTESALDGHLISIDPSIACIADVLEKYGVVSTEISTHKIFRNGVQSTLDQELCNGDVLTLPSKFVESLKIK